MEKFTNLGLSVALTDVLRQQGFKEPSEIQVKTIPLALAGRDIIGGSATGSGKTLAFASPILENLKSNGQIQALILTPTRELAEQVASSIRNFGKNKRLNVLAVYGGVNIDTQMRKIPSTDILVGTPGRILDHLNRRTLKLSSVKFLVLDEVDRMFDMGFRKDVEKIINECPKQRQTMMFSATISQDIDYLSKKYTINPQEISVKSYVDASKLKQFYYDVPDYQKFSLLVGLLKKENADLVMVFCNTRRNADFVTNNLIKSGINANAIHGGIEQNKRIRILDNFHKKGIGVLVCTDVAARGLDIKGVSHVYNYEVPSEPKDYIHRIGRTARAGKDGKAIIILASRDYENFRYLMRSQNIEIESKELPPIETINIKINTPRGNNRFIRGPKKDVSRGRGFDRNPERESRRENRDLGRSFGARRTNRNRYSRGREDENNNFRRNSSRNFGSKKRF
jgi:ATP-dependent RNA helicase DeaD